MVDVIASYVNVVPDLKLFSRNIQPLLLGLYGVGQLRRLGRVGRMWGVLALFDGIHCRLDCQFLILSINFSPTDHLDYLLAYFVVLKGRRTPRNKAGSLRY